MTVRSRFLFPLLFAATAACDDPFGPNAWIAIPDTVVLYSASRPELLGLPSAFDVTTRSRIVIETPTASGGWDFLLVEQEGGFWFVPIGNLPGNDSRAAIAPAAAPTLDEIARAPESGSFSDEPVRLQVGDLLIMRSRTAVCGFSAGVRYGKAEVVAIDPVEGTLSIAAITNPYCNDRDLIPAKTPN